MSIIILSAKLRIGFTVLNWMFDIKCYNSKFTKILVVKYVGDRGSEVELRR